MHNVRILICLHFFSLVRCHLNQPLIARSPEVRGIIRATSVGLFILQYMYVEANTQSAFLTQDGELMTHVTLILSAGPDLNGLFRGSLLQLIVICHGLGEAPPA
jgi:hypothetical protein